MLSLLTAVLAGIVVLAVVWFLLRAFVAVAFVLVLILVGIWGVDELSHTTARTPAASFAGLRHSVTRDVHQFETRVSRS